MLDFLIYGLITWALTAVLNATTFKQQPASRTTAWILTVAMFVISLFVLTTMQYIQISMALDKIGGAIKPQYPPLNFAGAFCFSLLFFSLLRKLPKPEKTLQKNSSHKSPSPEAPQPQTMANTSATSFNASTARENMRTTPAQSSAVAASTASDDLWAQALTEYESSSRNQGLWARLFSEAQGNEALVKVNYMRIRVDEMVQAISLEKERLEVLRIAESERYAARLEGMTAEQRKYEALSKGLCPNCLSAILPIDATHCPKCLAYFERSTKLKIKPLSESEQVNQLRLISLGGSELTEYEAELLKREQ